MNAARLQTAPLAGCNVVITRPAAQAHRLADLIRAAGGCAVLFPTLEIKDADDGKPLQQAVARLDEFDVAIFASANAVNKALSAIRARRALPPRLKFAVIGPGSRRELQQFGIQEVICATAGFDSEALLELLPEVRGKRIVIFRGQGGRALLAQTLNGRGALVEVVECYRRVKPQADMAPLLQLAQDNALHAVTATSSEGLRNLSEMGGAELQKILIKSKFYVTHARIAATARECGYENVILTAAGDEGLLQGLIAGWNAKRKHHE
ncbi:MAG: uroporphyrinogen-III synthase [Burkholderiales bacterium]